MFITFKRLQSRSCEDTKTELCEIVHRWQTRVLVAIIVGIKSSFKLIWNELSYFLLYFSG